MSLELPVKESLGVFVGLLGLDWLLSGRADLIAAVIGAIGTGVLVMLWRRRKRRREGG